MAVERPRYNVSKKSSLTATLFPRQDLTSADPNALAESDHVTRGKYDKVLSGKVEIVRAEPNVFIAADEICFLLGTTKEVCVRPATTSP